MVLSRSLNYLKSMKHIVAIFLLLIVANVAVAQITITAQDYITQDSGTRIATDYTASSFADFQVFTAAATDGQMWDISAKTFKAGLRLLAPQLYPFSSGFPLATDPHLAASTHVLELNQGNPNGYQYFRIDSTGRWLIGSVTDSFQAHVIQTIYYPPEQLDKFPLTYGTSWETLDTLDQYKRPAGETIVQSAQFVVDGFGTLKIPTAIEVPVLRLKTTVTTTTANGDSIKLSKHVTFQWMSHDGAYVLAIATDSNLNPLDVEYWVTARAGNFVTETNPNALVLGASPNPVTNGSIDLSFHSDRAGLIQISVMDGQARSVIMLRNARVALGDNTIPLDVRALPNGVYFARIITQGRTIVQKFIVTQ